MNKINEDELEKIKGGEAVSAVWIGVAISAALIFISGIIQGITNPSKCGS